MNDIAKMIMVAGALLLAAGALMALAAKIPGFGRLPGDIVVKKNNFTFYFPLATCILLSIILTLIINFFSRK